jgi:hypothetical protein
MVVLKFVVAQPDSGAPMRDLPDIVQPISRPPVGSASESFGPDRFLASAREALAALAASPGYRLGRLARAVDDPTVWCLVMEWDSVGAYRRALSSYEVKLRGTPFLSLATPEASAFEVLAAAEPGGEVRFSPSDRSPGGEVVPRPDHATPSPPDGAAPPWRRPIPSPP